MEFGASGLSAREAELLLELQKSITAREACERRIEELERWQAQFMPLGDMVIEMEGQWKQVRAALARRTKKPKGGAYWMSARDACTHLGYQRIDRLGERRRAGEIPEWAWRQERCEKTGKIKQVYSYRSDWVEGEKEE